MVIDPRKIRPGAVIKTPAGEELVIGEPSRFTTRFAGGPMQKGTSELDGYEMRVAHIVAKCELVRPAGEK